MLSILPVATYSCCLIGEDLVVSMAEEDLRQGDSAVCIGLMMVCAKMGEGWEIQVSSLCAFMSQSDVGVE